MSKELKVMINCMAHGGMVSNTVIMDEKVVSELISHGREKVTEFFPKLIVDEAEEIRVSFSI